MDGMSWTEAGTDASERIWPEASALVYDDAVKARTDHLYARVKDVVTPMEWPAFAPLIGEAIALGVPVLTCVNALNQEAFDQFSAGLQVRLEACETTVFDWCRTSRQDPLPRDRAQLG